MRVSRVPQPDNAQGSAAVSPLQYGGSGWQRNCLHSQDGPEIRPSIPAQEPGLHPARRTGHGARHRRQYRGLQRGKRGAAEAAGLPRSRPHRHASRLSGEERRRTVRFPRPDFHDWHNQSTAFAAMAYYANDSNGRDGGASAEYAHVAAATPEFFQVFAVEPVWAACSRPKSKSPAARARW